MLALVSIFLATLLISAAVIWLYRSVSSWRGFSTTVVARRGTNVKMRLKPQQGFISLLSPSSRQIKSTRAISSRGKVSQAKASRLKAAKLRSARIKSIRSKPIRTKSVILRNSTGTIKAPWGW